MGRRKKEFSIVDAPNQELLFDSLEGSRRKDYFEKIKHVEFNECIRSEDDYKGLDLEFISKTLQPTILGLSTSPDVISSIYWDEPLARSLIQNCQDQGTKLVAFSTIGADKKVIDRALGIQTSLEMWEDAQLSFYLCNADLCKMGAKEEDSLDEGSLGMMNLWTAASLYTNLPVWKECRGNLCEGPCPKHRVRGYCGMDSLAGLLIFLKTVEEMYEKNIPFGLYRELLELSELCDDMREGGIRVDVGYLRGLEEQFQKRKDELFPFEFEGKERIFSKFNPQSPEQIVEYFSSRGIYLKNAQEKEIHSVLERRAREYGYEFDEIEVWEDIPEELEDLYKTYQFKASGKGLKGWFNETYIDKSGRLHPRFIVTGTSTGRLSSSGPNFQNIPRVGFGRLVRRGVIAEEGEYLAKIDCSQLELRKCLHSAGFEGKLSRDVFKDLVEKSEGRFDQAAKDNSLSTRDMGKSTVHAANYLEGLDLLDGKKLQDARIKKEIEYGARLLFKDWEYCGRVVSFTGANLAQRLFKNKTYESRRKALEIQEIYFSAFPVIRKWQKKVGHQIQDRGYIQSGTGRYLELYGRPEDNLKGAAAFIGQGEGADHVQGTMLRLRREMGVKPKAQIHDELIVGFPNGNLTPLGDCVTLMEEETGREGLEGFSCPVKAQWGPTWLEDDMRKYEKGSKWLTIDEEND